MNALNETERRFWRKVRIGLLDQCWDWTGAKVGGYGAFSDRTSHRVIASRFALQSICPSKETGLFACHHCDRPSCCNPLHLFWGTPKDNSVDASSKGRFSGLRKTHCKWGHEFTPGNTGNFVNKRGKLNRYCKTCSIESSKRHWRRDIEKSRERARARYHAQKGKRQ